MGFEAEALADGLGWDGRGRSGVLFFLNSLCMFADDHHPGLKYPPKRSVDGRKDVGVSGDDGPSGCCGFTGGVQVVATKPFHGPRSPSAAIRASSRSQGAR